MPNVVLLYVKRFVKTYRWLLIFLIFWTLLSLFFLYKYNQQTTNLIKRGEKIKTVIADIQTQVRNENEVYHYLFTEFTTTNGEKLKLKSNIKGEKKTYKIGDSVTIYYSPEKPSLNFIYNESEFKGLKWINTFFILFPVLFLLITVVSDLLKRKGTI